MTQFVFDARDEAATRELGAALAACLPEGTLVALDGPLGAGKTQLVRGVAEALGVDAGDVVSPTFVLVQQYEGRRSIVHVDAYRVADEDEFRALGSDELLGSDALKFVEWADRVVGCLPPARISIRISELGPGARRFEIATQGREYAAVVETLADHLAAAN
jgi:tRNA threonylcarbamoyladenosine biosynthesis protein TsaE